MKTQVALGFLPNCGAVWVVPLLLGLGLVGVQGCKGSDAESDTGNSHENDVRDVAGDGTVASDIVKDSLGPHDTANDAAEDAPSDQSSDETSVPVCNATTWGSHGIGSVDLSFVDASRQDRILPTRVFYPTATPGDNETCYAAFLEANPLARMTMATICAVPDAEPDVARGPYPLVVISHGDGGQKEGHTYEAEYLATHGFVVAVLDHTGNCGFAQSGPEDLNMSVTRIQDVVFVLDELLAENQAGGALQSLVDPQRIGLAGHSWGGHATAVVAGLEYSWDVIQANCDAGTPYDEWYCPPLQSRELMEQLTPDPRVKALVTWAHDAGHIVAAPNCQGAVGVQIPWLEMVGTKDKYAYVQDDGWDCYNKTSGPACIVVLEGAGHLGYTGMGDDQAFGVARMFDLVRWYTTAFFLLHLGSADGCTPDPVLPAGLPAEDHTVECKSN